MPPAFYNRRKTKEFEFIMHRNKVKIEEKEIERQITINKIRP